MLVFRLCKYIKVEAVVLCSVNSTHAVRFTTLIRAGSFLIFGPDHVVVLLCRFVKAGIATSANSDQLLIALEPEAASIHIRRLRMRELVPDRPVRRPLSVRVDNDVERDVVGGRLAAEAEQVAAKFTQRTSVLYVKSLHSCIRGSHAS